MSLSCIVMYQTDEYFQILIYSILLTLSYIYSSVYAIELFVTLTTLCIVTCISWFPALSDRPITEGIDIINRNNPHGFLAEFSTWQTLSSTVWSLLTVSHWCSTAERNSAARVSVRPKMTSLSLFDSMTPIFWLPYEIRRLAVACNCSS